METGNNAEVKEEHVIVGAPNHVILPNQHVTCILLYPYSLYSIIIFILNMDSARNRLYRVFDEEEDEDEAENKNSWEIDDEVGDEDEVDDENEGDDEDISG